MSSDGENSDDSSVYSGLEDNEDSSETDHSENEDEDDGNRITGQGANEYDVDSSDEEDKRNTVGDIPLRWYDDYPHIGYDWDGQKILKPVESDQLDEFINKMENPNYWRTVHDKWTGQRVVLTDQDLQLIQNIQKTRYPDGDYDPYQPFEDFFTYKTMIHPVSNRPEHKRSFLPSKSEKEKVSKLVYAIKMGWMKPRPPKKNEAMTFYDLWDNSEQTELSKRMQHYIPAPKLALPGHEESYNPPPEYLMSKEELEKWKSQDPELRRISLVPRKYNCLRLVPSYKDFIKERFDRCLDLYLCPRQQKMRVNVDPEELIPKLPKPKDLQPFPTTQAIIYKGHESMVRAISTDPSGQFLASGSDDNTVRIWEVLTGRCLKKFTFEGCIKSLVWCPNSTLSLLALVIGQRVYLVNPGVGDSTIIDDTDKLLDLQSSDDGGGSSSAVRWIPAEASEKENGIRVVIEHPHEIKQVTWHVKGDYLATVTTANNNQSVLIHQLSSRRSQVPFRRTKGQVQKVLFHPLRPYFFVATQCHVRIYNLLKQQLSKKLLTNCKWLSSIDIHPQGDNVIIGSHDSRLGWFDLDLSVKPYKMLRHHKKAIRQVAYHKRYPLFASASDDGTVIVCHGMVYSDLLQNPLIVPVKVLKGHQKVQDLSVTDCLFHPYQPWLFTAGADSTIRLYT